MYLNLTKQISGTLSRLQGFRGTVCKVKASDDLHRLLNDLTSEPLRVITKAKDRFETEIIYLRKHGGKRARNPDSTHHAIDESRLREWQGRWEILVYYDQNARHAPGVCANSDRILIRVYPKPHTLDKVGMPTRSRAVCRFHACRLGRY